MDDIALLLDYLRPIAKNIDEIKVKIERYQIEFDELSRFFSCVKNDIKKISTYDNQEFIKNYLKSFSSNEKEFYANAYLVNANSNYIHILPQYKESIDYLNRFLSYLNIRKNEAEMELNNCLNIYNTKYYANKYCEIFGSDNYFIEDINDFMYLINSVAIDSQVKIRILENVIKNNVNNYIYLKSGIINDSDVAYVEEIIDTNKLLVSHRNLKFMIRMARRINLGHRLIDIVTEEILNDLSIDDIIRAKKIWVLKNIVDNHNISQYRKVKSYTNEFNYLLKIEKKLENIFNKKEIIRIIREETENE